MPLLLTIVSLVLIVAGIGALFRRAWLYGALLIVVGAAIGGYNVL